MKKYSRLIEWAKTGAIALLTALAVFLGAQTGLFNDFFRSIPVFSALAGALKDSQTAPSPVPGEILSEAARPSAIVLTDTLGGHHGVRYDTGALVRLYERASAVFAEALSTALAPKNIQEDEWRLALSAPGIYFEYITPVRLDVLAGWLDVKNTPDGMSAYTVRRACVTFSEESNTLYFESGGAFYLCETSAPSGRPSGLEGYADNGAAFAFETGRDFAFAPYTLILQQTEHHVLSSEITVTARQMIDDVLSSLNVVNQLESSYMKRGDLLVFIGQTFTVTAAPGGRVTLGGTVPIAEADIADEGQLIERARVIAAETIGKYSGDAECVYSGISADGTSRTVTFSYRTSGGLVHMYEDGCAAKITFTGGAITKIELIFRTFAKTGDMETLLPELLALAAAETEFTLCYLDNGGGYLYPFWAELFDGE